jgi:hypothetical protein
MRSVIEAAIIITVCGSAILRLIAAMCRLPSVKPDVNETDQVTELFKVLRRMNRYNFCAAVLMSVTALLAALVRYLG